MCVCEWLGWGGSDGGFLKLLKTPHKKINNNTAVMIKPTIKQRAPKTTEVITAHRFLGSSCVGNGACLFAVCLPKKTKLERL